jgi:hypothetical protein
VGAGRYHARVAAGLSRPTYAHIVRVSVVRGGGFGGLVRTTAADTRRLSPGDGDRLRALVRQAGLLNGPAGSGSGPGEPEPDRFTYAVTVEDEGLRREARFSERSLTDAVKNLISWVGSVDGHEESIEGPGGLAHDRLGDQYPRQVGPGPDP